LAMGEDEASRQRAYARFVSADIDADEQALIRTAVRRNQLTGRGRFVDEIERRTGLRIEARGPGRPRKDGK
ncbi:MAG: transposase, partial [Woeseiaceae bacterium]